MPHSTLDPDGQTRLAKVLGTANGNPDHIPYAVRVVLSDVEERGRRVYLRNELTRRARRRIRTQQRKPKEISEARSEPAFVFTVTPAHRLDARRHEQALCRWIPEEDL